MEDDERLKRYQRLADAPTYTATEIRTIRLDAGLTLREFAERLGVGQSTVEMWEMEDYPLPDAPNRIRIQEEFGDG